MRYVAAVMYHETNTFSPMKTRLSDFDRTLGTGKPPGGKEAIDAYMNTNSALASFVDLAAKQNTEIIVPVAANANPSGIVEDIAFDFIADSICETVKMGCDAVLLDLHGAMVTESYDDAEGELLKRIRSVSDEIPIAVALDFHTNLTSDMVNLSTVLTGYRTYPHIDIYETGKRAGRILTGAINKEIKPITSWFSLPILTHMLCQDPGKQPMKDIMDKAIDAGMEGKVLNATIFGGFPLSDIPHVGLSGVVTTDDDVQLAENFCAELADMAWNRRQDFIYPVKEMKDSIRMAGRLKEGPVILADHGDNCGAGGSQDVMDVLEELIFQDFENVAAGPFCDPETVSRMVDSGVGSSLTIDLGGKTEMPAINLKGRPLRISGKVTRITDGCFIVTGPMMTGMTINMGRTAVFDTGKMEIVVSEERFEPCDTGCFTHAGIDPASKNYILIKSRQHFRAGFEPIAKHIVLIDGPGVCSSDYNQFPFKNLRRPIFPLDPEMIL